MKKQSITKSILLPLFCSVTAFFTACSNDDTDPVLKPEVQLNIKEENIEMVMGEQLSFSATNPNDAVYEESWTIDDNVAATTSSYEFIPEKTGSYILVYKAFNEAGEFTHQYKITVDAKIRPITDTSIAYVSELLEFLPAPGQFINKAPGNLESAEGIIGKKGGMVSLGAWGGAATYAFDHTVINVVDSNDIVVYGNAFTNFSEPGIIWVMQDENANGVADDTWYEIKGNAHSMESSLQNYSITYFRPETDAHDVPWEDNQGNSGVVKKNNFHTQPYYPEWIEEGSYTLSGTVLTNAQIDMSNPSYITSGAFEYGYADNTSGGDEVDLADAIDANGEPVRLKGIDFIKIQTGIQANMGWLGELSTEITGIADVSMLTN